MTRRLLLATILAAASLLPAISRAATLTVNSLLDHDDGSCSYADCTLREAIEEAEPGDTINFAFATLPATGPVIELQSALPWLEVTGLTLDGYDCTGCGSVVENTSLPADGLDLQVGPTLDGSLLPVHYNSDLITIDGEDITVRGLNLANSADEAVTVRSGGDGAVIEGCLIGTDRTGTVAQPSLEYGVFVWQADDVTIGPYNLISGNVDAGIRIFPDYGSANDGLVIGNLIGTDITGTLPLPNGVDGIRLFAEDGPTIDDWSIGDGTEPGRNIISGNTGAGIAVVGNVDDLVIEGNTIGTDGAQSAALPNTGWGIAFLAPASPRADRPEILFNTIAGNGLGGVQMEGVSNGDLLGNAVGTDSAGLLDLGNGGDGIHMFPSNNRQLSNMQVGGTAGSPLGNTIAFNAGDGIRIHPENNRDARRVDILVNSWFANGGLAVDLEMASGGGDGPGAPPPGSCANDGDWGNRGKGPPEIAWAELLAGALEVAGTACAGDIVGLYLADGDPSGYGEPQTWIGVGTADAVTGDWAVVIAPTAVVEGDLLTAMARDGDPETSEASTNVVVVDCDSDGDGGIDPVCAGDDCDDDDPLLFAGAPELCDGVDNDCDGVVPAAELDGDGDGVPPCDGDCDDADPLVFAGAPELCNGLDEDCDGAVPPDEADADTDGSRVCDGDCDDGDSATWPGALETCDGLDNDCDGALPPDEADADLDGSRPCNGDCDDGDPATWPGALETCDGLDNDCDGSVPPDEADADLDGSRPCEGDCDDADPTSWPGAVEACDGLDNDCDGVVPPDELDVDLDGSRPCDGDCDDADPTTLPGAVEACDGLDNDCDGVVPSDEADVDLDGSRPCEGDCDDADPTSWPGAVEACDGLDNDCDAVVPSDELDDDLDGWSPCAGDCDDTESGVHPGQVETSPVQCSNGLDDDCDGLTDAADPGCPVGDDDDSASDDDDIGPDDDDSASDDDDIGPNDDDSGPDDDDSAPDDDDSGPDDDDSGPDDDDSAPDDDDSASDDDDDVDSDGDGVTDDADCAPDDPAVYPGAPEVCDDGVDQDCDGDVDGGAGDPECWSTGCLGCRQVGSGGSSGLLALVPLALLAGRRRRRQRPRSRLPSHRRQG